MTDPDPTPERRQDPWSRERITKVLQASIEDRKHLNKHLSWVERAVVAQGIVLVVSMILIAGIPVIAPGGLIGANADRATESKRVADKLALVVATIQQEREANIGRSCVDQNTRHDNTIRELDARLELASQTLSPAQRAQLEQSRDFTVALIDALAPRRDCAAVKAQQIPSAQREMP